MIGIRVYSLNLLLLLLALPPPPCILILRLRILLGVAMPPGNKQGPSSTATNLSGKSAMHPKLRMTWKRALKIERIARLSADPAGYSNEQIANMLNCDKQTIVYIRQLPEYHAKMIEISSGVVSAYDQQLRENVDNVRDELRSMVPSAMMVIRNALHGKHGGALAFKAAQEILDREGTAAKVSKTSVSHEVKIPLDVDPEVSANLMQLLAGAPTRHDTSDASVNAGFTRSAGDALIQQGAMGDTNTPELLASLDLGDKKPN
jgi:hypothetical protein